MGLVATAGGAIEWIKFHAAQLPANQAINVIPNHELIVIGAANLIIFGAAGVLALAVVYALDREGRNSKQTQAGLIALGVAAGIYAATRADKSWWQVTLAAGIAAIAPAVVVLAPPFRVGAGGRLAVSWPRLVVLTLTIGALLVIVRLLLIREWWLALAILTAVLIVLLDLGVARASGDKFAWYGAAIFISVGLFGFALHVLRTHHAPEVQPAIVLRAGVPTPVIGIYVTQTDDRIYIGGVDCRRRPPAGRLEITPNSGRIYWLPLDKVTTASIGPSKELDEASQSTARMIKELETFGLQAVPTPAAARGTGRQAGAKRQAAAKGTAKARATAVAKAQVPPPGAICLPEPPPEKRRRPDYSGMTVTGRQAFAAARKFRPLLIFDSEERWRPLNVPRFLAEYFQRPFGLGHHRLCAGESTLEASCRDIVGLADFDAVVGRTRDEEKTFLDVSGGSKIADYCAPDRCGEDLADCDDCKKSAIYYNVTKGNARLYIDYWWFLRFNQVTAREAIPVCLRTQIKHCFDHEGDWEGVTVVTSARPPRRLEYVTFASHEKTIRFRRAQLTLDGERPVVHIARGTHAAYPTPCSTKCRQSFRRLFPEGRHDGKAPWGRNDDSACFDAAPCLLPFPEAVRRGKRSWNRWSGSWGSCGNSGLRCTVGRAPKSPSAQARFTNPTCFDLGMRLLCDHLTPGTTTSAPRRTRSRQA